MLINKEAFKEYMLSEMEHIIICTNEDVQKYCEQHGIDTYDFIDLYYKHAEEEE